MCEHINFSRRYRADLVFAPWEGHPPWALSLSVTTAAPEREQR
jgi:hypothetical protein